MKKTKLYLGIPSTGTRSDLQTYVLRDLEKKYADKIEFVYPERCVHRKFHDFARNEVVKEFLATECDILWFLDSDVVPPPHVLDLITEHGEHWELAGAPYPVFMTPTGFQGPQVVMCVYAQGENGGMHTMKVPQKGVQFVDGLATGCIFIKREVFAQLQEPYFAFKYNEKNMHIEEGEDLGFCRKVSALGYKFFTDFSMACKHYKTVDLLEVNNYAIDQANQSVQTYDAQIRPTVVKLAQEVERLKASRNKSGLILPK
jgi:hypothetical protein